ncbi:hypothetical protein GCM10012275_33120 [Longimycelium tulufanense]|uniref:Ricin B lectin domain-containing protein n=1 Tax=Longimycelium tulufanense TaxID=907463 RepID=A0A8J3FV00_9PSEU|nr:hypothetical protein GCM10012275_33120 [Longimycelium tulufanense]
MAAAFALLPTSGASAASPEPMVAKRYVQNVEYRQVMDVEAGRTTKGTPIYGWNLHFGQNQQFKLLSYPDGSTVFKGVQSNLCVDVKGGEQARMGAPLVLQDCDRDATQHWRQQAGLIPGSVVFRNEHFHNACLTQPARSSRLVIEDCSFGDQTQEWYVR